MAISEKLQESYPDLISVFQISGLNANQIQALVKIGIHTKGDLIRYNPYHYARLMKLSLESGFSEELNIRTFVDFQYERKAVADIMGANVDAMEGIGPVKARLLRDNFDIATVEDLANSTLFTV